MLNQQGRMCNVVVALRHRSTRLGSWNTDGDLLHQHGEMLAATQCEDNCKVDLPQQSKSTFMTAFSPNCELIASCHGDHNVYVTNIVTGKVVTSLVGHERSPWCISFHPTSNEILATGCLNGEVSCSKFFDWLTYMFSNHYDKVSQTFLIGYLIGLL